MNPQLLQMVKQEKNLAKEFVASREGKPVYLYGAGFAVNFAIKFCKKYGVPVLGILDSHKEGAYTHGGGLASQFSR